MSYHGRIVEYDQLEKKWPPGQTLPSEGRYFLIGAVFETDSDKYGWLNDIVAVGKNVPDAVGEGNFVRHELYVAK